jgi:hypothetical protein
MGEQMNLHQRALAVIFLAATALGALGAPAVAAPMPWETSKVSVIPGAGDGHDGAVTVQCGTPCYQ